MEEELHLKMKDDTDKLSTLLCKCFTVVILLQVHLIMTTDLGEPFVLTKLMELECCFIDVHYKIDNSQCSGVLLSSKVIFFSP